MRSVQLKIAYLPRVFPTPKKQHMELGTRRREGESSQYPAVHGLEAVTDVGERTAEQHGHGVRHVGLRGLLVQLYGENPLLDRSSTSAVLPAAGRRRRRCAPIVATVAAARAEAARGPRGEGRGSGGRGREEAEGGRGCCGSGGAAAGSGAEDGGGGAEEAREREAERGGKGHRFAVCSREATAAWGEKRMAVGEAEVGFCEGFGWGWQGGPGARRRRRRSSVFRERDTEVRGAEHGIEERGGRCVTGVDV